MANLTPLCRLDDIPDGSSEGFVAEIDGVRTSLAAIRRGANVWVYINSCPHIGAPLEFRKGQFLDREGTHILCSNHGALFDIETGACVRGPCSGDSLTPVKTIVKDGQVFIA